MISSKATPPLKLSDIAMKLVRAYKVWNGIVHTISKMRRYSLGIKIDGLFAEVLELISTAQFSTKTERLPLVSRAIAKNDVLKAMFYIMLELDGITETSFVAIAPQLEEVGRMLYSWRTRIIVEQTKPPRT